MTRKLWEDFFITLEGFCDCDSESGSCLKIDKFNYAKIKNFCLAKIHIIKVKRLRKKYFQFIAQTTNIPYIQNTTRNK